MPELGGALIVQPGIAVVSPLPPLLLVPFSKAGDSNEKFGTVMLVALAVKIGTATEITPARSAHMSLVLLNCLSI
jgi:hypothetical protein